MVDGAAWVGGQLAEIGGDECERKKGREEIQKETSRERERERERGATVKGTERSDFFSLKITLIFNQFCQSISKNWSV